MIFNKNTYNIDAPPRLLSEKQRIQDELVALYEDIRKQVSLHDGEIGLPPQPKNITI